MSVVRDTYDDEIDLFELFEILWGGKWLIIGVSLLMGLIGFGYTQINAETQYETSVPYVVGVYPVASQQACGENVGCMENEVTKKLTVLLDSDWEVGGMLRRTTPQRPDVASYQADLKRANERITQEAYADATTELAWIENELNDDLLATEIVATNVLNAKRVIAFIDGGGAVITFGDISVEEKKSETLKVGLLFVVLGGILGIFSVFIHNAIRLRNDNMADS